MEPVTKLCCVAPSPRPESPCYYFQDCFFPGKSFLLCSALVHLPSILANWKSLFVHSFFVIIFLKEKKKAYLQLRATVNKYFYIYTISLLCTRRFEIFLGYIINRLILFVSYFIRIKTGNNLMEKDLKKRNLGLYRNQRIRKVSDVVQWVVQPVSNTVYWKHLLDMNIFMITKEGQMKNSAS